MAMSLSLKFLANIVQNVGIVLCSVESSELNMSYICLIRSPVSCIVHAPLGKLSTCLHVDMSTCLSSTSSRHVGSPFPHPYQAVTKKQKHSWNVAGTSPGPARLLISCRMHAEKPGTALPSNYSALQMKSQIHLFFI